MQITRFSAKETGLSNEVHFQLTRGQMYANNSANEYAQTVWERLMAEQEAFALRVEAVLAPLREMEDKVFVELQSSLSACVDFAKTELAEMRLTERRVAEIEAYAHTILQCVSGA